MANNINYNSKIVYDDAGEPVVDPKVKHTRLDKVKVLDEDWVRVSFMVPNTELDALDRVNRFWSSANTKFTDTTIGGNIGINSRPQFTRYADIRVPGRLSHRVKVSTNSITGNHGMGRYYSESIDDNSETIFMEFGVAEHTSLLRFISVALDPNAAFLANTGRSSAWYKIGSLIGTALLIKFVPVIGAMSVLSQLIGGTVGKVIPSSSSRYYTLKPTMTMYWTSVNSLVSSIAVDLGIMPIDIKSKSQRISDELDFNTTMSDTLHSIFPSIIFTDGAIDVFAMANRTQVLANRMYREEHKNFTTKEYDNYEGFIQETYSNKVDQPIGEHTLINNLNNTVSFRAWFDKTVNTIKYTADQFIGGGDDKKDLKTKEPTLKAMPTETIDYYKKDANGNVILEAGDVPTGEIDKMWLAKFYDATDAQLRDGSIFATFKVDYTGSITESFSNSVEDSGIKSSLQGITDTTRSIKFNLGGGNLIDDPVSSVIEGIVSRAAQTVTGAAGAATFGVTNVITALMGGGFIDVPKRWSNSTVSLPSISYNMKLISPYNNPVSLLQNIYIPLAMIMAGVLPKATGKTSYTSPFLCNVYNRGKQKITLGIIESMSINRGTSNLGFSATGKPLAIDVSFNVLDLSSVMSMPVDSGGLFGINMTLDEDHLLSNYISTITGRDLYSQRYFVPKMMINTAKLIARAKTAVSPSKLGMLFGDNPLIKNTYGLFVGASAIAPIGKVGPSADR